MIGGPNGASMTTFARAAAPQWHLRYLAADLVAERLGLDTAGADAVRAGRVFTEDVREALSQGESLLIESTLSGHGIRRSIRRAKGSGYRVSVGYLFLGSPERPASGGSEPGFAAGDTGCPMMTCAADFGVAW
jgi:predicted ABC-type ATPase